MGVEPKPDEHGIVGMARLFPDQDDPQYRLHVALLEAADAGDVQAVDDLLQKGAPVRWDTSEGNPLITAARWHKIDVVTRLLRLDAATFPLFDIEDAVVAATDANDVDDSTLRLLISRFGPQLSAKARARILRKAGESMKLDSEFRTAPSGPAVRFLIDEAKFDVNTPLSDSGDTLLDLASIGNESHQDHPLIAFVKARGGRSGLARK